MSVQYQAPTPYLQPIKWACGVQLALGLGSLLGGLVLQGLLSTLGVGMGTGALGALLVASKFERAYAERVRQAERLDHK